MHFCFRQFLPRIPTALFAIALAVAPLQLRAQDPAPTFEPATSASILGAVGPDPALAKVVARVNGEEITEGDRNITANKMMFQYLQRLGPAAQNLPPGQLDLLREEMRKNAIEQTVNVKLIEQERAKVNIPNEEIDLQIKTYEEQIKAQGGSLEQYLATQGMTEPDLRRNIQTRLQVEQILEKRAGKELDPTEEEMKAFYEENKEQMVQQPQVQASHILIGFPGDPRSPDFAPPADEVKAELRKKAEEVLAKAKSGEDFAALAEQYSTDPSVSMNRGDLGMNPRGRMVKPFDDAQWSMEVGQISDVVETPFGYHIIKVTGKEGDKTRTFEDMKELIRREMVTRKFETGMKELLADLRNEAKIEILDPIAAAAAAERTTQTATQTAPQAKAGAPKGMSKAKTKSE